MYLSFGRRAPLHQDDDEQRAVAQGDVTRNEQYNERDVVITRRIQTIVYRRKG